MKKDLKYKLRKWRARIGGRKPASTSKRVTDIKKPKFNNDKAIASSVTKQMTYHMKAVMAAKDEKAKVEAYSMALVKKNGIKVTLPDMTSKPTVTDVDAPLSIKSTV